MHAEAEIKGTKNSGKSGATVRRYSLGLQNYDFFLLMVTLVLVAFGLIMVFSASYYYSISMTDSQFSYLIRDSIWVFLGLILMVFGALFDYRAYNNRRFAFASIIVCFALLILVLTSVGQNINGASRWIALGPITIMPGELSKLGLIFFIAWFFGDHVNKVKSFSRGILPIAVLTLVFAFMIIKQPNLSTAITVCGIAAAMLLVAGMKWRYIGLLAAAGVAGLGGLIMFASDSYWMSRITSFLDPFQDAAGEGYQVVQSLLALGSGGLFGVGLGNSVQKSLYLPEPQNDFILAIIGEELGYLGILALLVVYCLFIWRGARIALRSKDQFGMLLASGIVIMVAIQVILNVAVVTSSMPATGINLPFVSYGGNALIMFMYSAGVLLNISRHDKPYEDAAGERRTYDDRRRRLQ